MSSMSNSGHRCSSCSQSKQVEVISPGCISNRSKAFQQSFWLNWKESIEGVASNDPITSCIPVDIAVFVTYGTKNERLIYGESESWVNTSWHWTFIY